MCDEDKDQLLAETPVDTVDEFEAGTRQALMSLTSFYLDLIESSSTMSVWDFKGQTCPITLTTRVLCKMNGEAPLQHTVSRGVIQKE